MAIRSRFYQGNRHRLCPQWGRLDGVTYRKASPFRPAPIPDMIRNSPCLLGANRDRQRWIASTCELIRGNLAGNPRSYDVSKTTGDGYPDGRK
jgi:hypothetical protein